MDNMTDYTWLMPSDTILPDMSDINDDPLNQFFIENGAKWPKFIGIGTRVFINKAILYIRMDLKMTKAETEQLFLDYDLAWESLGIRSAYSEWIDTGEVDGEGNPIYEEQYDVTQPITWAEMNRWYADIAVENESPNPPTYRRPGPGDIIYTPVYAGTSSVSLEGQ